MNKRCECPASALPHKPLEGRATSRAGAYSTEFAIELGQLVWEHVSEGDLYLEDPAFVDWTRGQKQGRHVSHLWAVQLSESLPWKLMVQKRFRIKKHINLLEAEALGLLFRDAPPRLKSACGTRLQGVPGSHGERQIRKLAPQPHPAQAARLHLGQ